MGIEGRLTRYSGYVQGVGFRYTALRIAQGHPNVVGYVTNLADGRVEIVAEGPRGDLQAFLGEISRTMGEQIRDESSQVRPASGAFCGFSIR